MSKFAQGALSVAVAIAAFYGVQHYKQQAVSHEPTAEELSKSMDELQARAERDHPTMAKTDALKETAAKESATRLAAQSSEHQANTAADMFWGFYWVNTKARVEYCARRGVDLTPFTTAFVKEHGAELARAKAIYAAAGIDPEITLPKLQLALSKVVDQDMKDVTSGAQVPLDQACTLFNENAEQLAKLIQMPPHVKQALMRQG